MPEVQAIPLIANILGLNREAAVHRLSPQESPASLDVDYAGDLAGLLGPRGGRSRALRGGGTLRGVMPFFFPWGPYRVIAYDDTYSADPVTWPSPTLPSIPALPSLGGLFNSGFGSGNLVHTGGSADLAVVTPWGTCNSGNITVSDPYGGTVVYTNAGSEQITFNCGGGPFVVTYTGGLIENYTSGVAKTCLVNGVEYSGPGAGPGWDVLVPASGSTFYVYPLV